MRNIPVFTTEFGVASLILREIPYTQTAYVRIQSSLSPCELLDECAGFCRAAGAERVYAVGTDIPDTYPFYTQIVRMEVSRSSLPKTEAIARPVLPENADHWRKLYNQTMKDVENTSYMDDLDVKQMLEDGDGYFVYLNDTPIGIGRGGEDHILVVASLVRGGGRDTLLALADRLSGEQLKLEVATTNARAIRLYESLGFYKTEEFPAWYKIL